METLQKARWGAWTVFAASLIGVFALPAGWPRVFAIWAWLASMVGLIVIRWRIRKLAGPPPKTERGVVFVSVAALIWAGLDAFLFGQGVIAFVVFAVGLLYLVPRALLALRGDRALFKLRLAKAGVTMAAGAAAIAAIGYANRVAEDRALAVISAVETFKAKRGRYPDRLNELVPAFLPAVPSAKPYGMLGQFQYWSSQPPDVHHTLMYTALPPFGRRLYNFEEHRWSALD